MSAPDAVVLKKYVEGIRLELEPELLALAMAHPGCESLLEAAEQFREALQAALNGIDGAQ